MAQTLSTEQPPVEGLWSYRLGSGRPLLYLPSLWPGKWQASAAPSRNRQLDWTPRPNLSQLCPDNWVPERPAASQWISVRYLTCPVTRTDWDWAGPSRTQREPTDLPDNAEVAGSIPASPTSNSPGGLRNLPADSPQRLAESLRVHRRCIIGFLSRFQVHHQAAHDGLNTSPIRSAVSLSAGSVPWV